MLVNNLPSLGALSLKGLATGAPEPSKKRLRTAVADAEGDLLPWEELSPHVKEVALELVFGKQKFSRDSSICEDLVSDEDFWHAQCTKMGWDRDDRTTGYHAMEPEKWQAQFIKWCGLLFDNGTITNTVAFLSVLNPTGEWPEWATSTASNPVESWKNAVWEKVKKYGPISTWDTSKVTSMDYLFRENEAFNADIGKWDVSNVERMNFMFKGALSFNHYLGLWDVGNVMQMIGMFSDAKAFNQSLNQWDVSKLLISSEMFKGASTFNNGKPAKDASNPLQWNVSSLRRSDEMFCEASAFNQDLLNEKGTGDWDISNLKEETTLMFHKSALEKAGRLPKWYRPGGYLFVDM